MLNKKNLLRIILILGIFNYLSLYADEPLNPEKHITCGINGITYNYDNNRISDTSSWKIPVAYEGECKDVPNLSENEKEKIYNIIFNYFLKYIEKENYDDSYYSLNEEGIELVDKLFLNIQKYIKLEMQKETPNLKKVSILNYLADIIKYDYYISSYK